MSEPRYGYAVDILRDKVKEQLRERRFALGTGNEAYAGMTKARIQDLNGAIVDLGGTPIVWEADDA